LEGRVSQKSKIAVLGASGYTGAEIVRLVATHPHMEIVALTASRKAGMKMSEVFPSLRHLDLPDLVKIEEVDFSNVDLVFCGLPHGHSQAIVRKLPAHIRIVDMGADFRLRDPADYEKWYNRPHDAPDIQPQAVYGLTEFYREDIKNARLVAGTGCNAATVQFALRPLISAGVIDLDEIICDLKNGISGAGRALKESMLYTERSQSVMGYSLGGTHRHLGEFDQEFSALAGRDVRIMFTPHLVPANRGVFATCYLKGDADAVHKTLVDAYRNEPFICVLPMGEMPSMADVQGSNIVHIGVAGDRLTGRATVIATLDNLCKGSSGQAMQNANLMLGLDEVTGLTMAPIFP
jgi:N-acetyl-gamma-glutamyl-phosphate reductase